MTSQGGASDAPVDDEDQLWELKKEQELRIEVGGPLSASAAPSASSSSSSFKKGASPVSIQLLDGSAELFGTELAQGKEYAMPPFSKFAIFTWEGCRLVVRGKPEVMYYSEETPMVSYVNAHAGLDKMRQSAQRKGANGRGPVTVIVGPTDAGKSTVSRILLGYAVRAGWCPTFVDLDVGQSNITVPGSIAATPIKHPAPVESPNTLTDAVPIVFCFGHVTPSGNIPIYKQMTDRLAAAVEERLSGNDLARHSGVLINTCGWTDGDGYDLLVHAAVTFQADIVIVLGQDRLWSQLKSDGRLKGVTVSKLAKSGGVVVRDTATRRRARDEKFREYFYGKNHDLTPMTKVVPFGAIHIYQAGGGVAAPSSTLPIGATPLLDPDRMIKVEESDMSDLKHTVMAISFAKNEETLADMNVAGFVHVTDVDTAKRRLTLLCPSSGPLLSSYAIRSTVKWIDST